MPRQCCCSSATPCGSYCVQVVGCDSTPIIGATVTITGPGTITTSPCTTVGQVTAVNVTSAGSGYTSAPSVSFSGGGGSGATATALAVGTVASFTLTAGGSGYTCIPTVTVSGGGGAGASAAVTLTGTSVASVTVTNGGSGYATPPTVSFTGFGGSGAAATANIMAGAVTSVTVTAGGSGYTGAPIVHFSSGTGSGAAATSVLTPTSVASIARISSGSNYSSAPTVTISGCGGAGATATATLSTLHVASVTVTNGGSGYTSAPTVSFSGGGGSGAAAGATVAGQCCVTITQSGSYTATIAATGNYASSTIHPSLTCTANISTVTLSPTSGYSCTPDPCCPVEDQSGPPYVNPAFTYPSTLLLNDGSGSVTLTRYGSMGSYAYAGCATRTATQASTNCVLSTCTSHIASASVPVLFVLDPCVGPDGDWQLEIRVPTFCENNAGPDYYAWPDSGGTCTAGLSSSVHTCDGAISDSRSAFDSAASASCTSLSLSFSFTFSATSLGNPSFQQHYWIYGTSATITVS